MIKFFSLALLLFLPFLSISCGGGAFILVAYFDIELYDENDNAIIKKEDLESFEVSKIDKALD